MVSNRLSNVRGAIVALGLFFTLAGQTGWAGTFTWTGASSTNWTVSGNWLNSAVPGATDVARFAAGSYANQPNLVGAQAAGGLWDTGLAGVTVSGVGLTLNGATINGNPNTGIGMDASAGSLAITAGITLGSAQTWYNNSGSLLTLGGTVNNGGNTLTVGGSGASQFSGGLSGAGGLTVAGGVVGLTGTGITYTGSTIISGGILRLGVQRPTGVLPTGGLLYDLDPSNAASLTIIGGNVTNIQDLSLAGTNSFGNAASTVTVVNGGTAFNNRNVLNFNNVGTATLTMTNASSPKTVFIIEQVAANNNNWDNIWGDTGIDEDIRDRPGLLIQNPGDTQDYTNGTGGALYVNGVFQAGNATAGTPQLLTAYAGANTTGPLPWASTSLSNGAFQGRNFSGQIGEVLAYSTSLSAAQMQQADAYLMNKWFPAATSSNVLPVGAHVQISAGAALDLNDTVQTIASLSGASGASVYLGSAALTVAGSGSTTYAGSISDSGGASSAVGGSLIMAGSGILVLSGSNAYSGGTTIGGGMLQLGNSAAMGVGPLAANGGTLNLAGNSILVSSFSGAAGLVTSTVGGPAVLTVNQPASLSAGFSGSIADGGGPVALKFNGPGTLLLAGSNAYSGGTTVSGGVLVIANSSNSISGGITVANGVLQAPYDAALGLVTSISLSNGSIKNDGDLFNGAQSYQLSLGANRNLTVSSTGYFQAGYQATGQVAVNGQIGGTGSVGIVWDLGTVVFGGSNGYTGNTLIGTTGVGTISNTAAYNTMTLQLANSNALPPTTNVIFGVLAGANSGNAATLDVNGYNSTIGGLSGGTNAYVNNSAAGSASTLTVGSNNASATFSGVLENNGSGGAKLALVKSGTGTQVLAGANTYTGGTVVNAGTLQAVNAAALGNVANTLQVNGGLLDMYGNNIKTGLLSGSGGSISSSAGTAVLTISNTGLSSSFSGGIVNSSGGQPGLTLGAGTLTLLGGNTYTGPTTVSPNTMLQVGGGGILGGTAGTPVTLNGVLALGDGSGPAGLVTAASLAGTGSIVGMSSSNSTLVVNYNGATLDRFASTIGGSGANQNNIALTFVGSGQVGLTGVSTYIGSTTVSAGTLNLTGRLPNSNVNVLTGGALVGAGDGVTTGIVGGNLTAGSSSIIGALAGDSGSSLTISGSLTLGGTQAHGQRTADHADLCSGRRGNRTDQVRPA